MLQQQIVANRGAVGWRREIRKIQNTVDKGGEGSNRIKFVMIAAEYKAVSIPD